MKSSALGGGLLVVPLLRMSHGKAETLSKMIDQEHGTRSRPQITLECARGAFIWNGYSVNTLLLCRLRMAIFFPGDCVDAVCSP